MDRRGGETSTGRVTEAWASQEGWSQKSRTLAGTEAGWAPVPSTQRRPSMREVSRQPRGRTGRRARPPMELGRPAEAQGVGMPARPWGRKPVPPGPPSSAPLPSNLREAKGFGAPGSSV